MVAGDHAPSAHPASVPQAQAAAPPWIGKSVRARETLRPIRGLARYVDDLVLPGAAHLAIVRSPVAHARIRRIDTAAARRVPGVLAVVTGADLADRTDGFPVNVQEGARVTAVPHRALATDTVRYAGEPVAAVAAETPEAAF